LNIRNLDLLEAEALNRLVHSPFEPSGIYIGHSGGKDSVVVHYLATQIFQNIPVVHTPKPEVTHFLTLQFLYSRNFPIQYIPKEHHSRFGFKTQIDGTRIAESSRTDGRSTTVVIDGVDQSRTEMEAYVKNGLFGLNFIYPIVDWTDDEVWAFIKDRNLEVSKEYSCAP